MRAWRSRSTRQTPREPRPQQLSARTQLFAWTAATLAIALAAGAGGLAAVRQGWLSTPVALLLGTVLVLALAAAVAQRATRALRGLARVAPTLAEGALASEAAPGRSGAAVGAPFPGLAQRAVAAADRDSAAVATALDRMAGALASTGADLVTERDRLGAVLEGMAEGVVALDSDGRIGLCNRSATVLLGCSEPPLGRRLIGMMRQPALHRLLAAGGAGRDDEVAPAHAVREAEISLKDEGVGQHLLVTARPLGQAGLGTVLVLRDVTAIRRLDKVRRDFIANASHELRTPVATIQASAESLLAGGLDEPEVAREFTGAILRHAGRMSQIITDLLDLSRIEAGAYALVLGPVAVHERLLHAVGLLEATTRERRQTVTVRSTAVSVAQPAVTGPPLLVRANAQALDQVLLNLLDNASKYSAEGAHIELGAAIDRDRVVLQVCDDGPGIALHQRERVFERFYRIDAGRSRDVGGTGLGLAIVRHLVDGMGGRVGVSGQEPLLGAVFWVELPLWRGDGVARE